MCYTVNYVEENESKAVLPQVTSRVFFFFKADTLIQANGGSFQYDSLHLIILRKIETILQYKLHPTILKMFNALPVIHLLGHNRNILDKIDILTTHINHGFEIDMKI